MSCWVVPSVAAELWGVSVEQVQARIREGSLPSKQDSGFTVIDVAPDSPVAQTPKTPRPPAPPTYRAVTREEIRALVGDAVEFDLGDDESDVQNWRVGRSEASRIRRPPEAVAA